MAIPKRQRDRENCICKVRCSLSRFWLLICIQGAGDGEMVVCDVCDWWAHCLRAYECFECSVTNKAYRAIKLN